MDMPRSRERVPLDCKVYVGELGDNATRHELEDAFGYYGPLKEVWVARNPPGFAFVMFQDSRDARDAVRNLDGKIICGKRARVELSTGKARTRGGGGGGGGGGMDRGGRNFDRRGPPPRDRGYGGPPPRRGDPYSRRDGDYDRDFRNGAPNGRRNYSRSRSPSMGRGRPRTPPSRSRSRSPIH